MEVIHKKILIRTVTGATTGETINYLHTLPNGNEYTLDPEEIKAGDSKYSIVSGGTIYCFNICLTSDSRDLGFFNSEGNIASGNTTNSNTYRITGITASRLDELEKYTSLSGFINKYISSNSNTNNGVNYLVSLETKITYYIDGATYIDDLIKNVTTFDFMNGCTDTDELIFYKNELIDNIVSDVEVESDVFIERSNLSVFDTIYKLENIENISQLETFVGGGLLNIVGND